MSKRNSIGISIELFNWIKNNLCLHLDTISVQLFDHFSLQSNVIPRYLKLSQISTIELSIERGT